MFAAGLILGTASPPDVTGFAPIFTGQRPYQGPSPIFFQSVPGEAKPRRTSGGKAGKKVLLGQS
ncbi:MAG TPA: hypothetical protein VFS77_10300, partial [Pyrinomonadaceae bacterium]|nr:hypothetical protein [Pyrinomonadaceae bacterium]